MSQLKVTYVKSVIGYSHDQKRTVASLGLRKIRQSVLLPDNAAVRGMCFKVRHLVLMEEVAAADAAAPVPSGKSRTYTSAAGDAVVTTARSKTYETSRS
ncbi:MAG: 50S ribosomal protein L30 [Herpetosiphonaceae bacterium]|nr:50S ribosomal protein L30 [Herpetosiphonaceae bacterium]